MNPTPDQIAADLLLEELAARGIRAEVRGEELCIRPRGKVAPDLAARLRRYKAEVVRALRLAALDEDRLYQWQERVAIAMEDGGLDQMAAEALAWRKLDAGGAEAGSAT